MPRERFDPKRGWVAHEQILKELEEKERERGVLPPTEKAELERLKNAKARENETGKKGGSSLFK